MHQVWGWNPATLFAIGIAVLAMAAIVVVTRDGVDRGAVRAKAARLVQVDRDRAAPGAVALVLTNLGEQPVFLRSVLLWVDMQVQPGDLLVDRKLVTTRWPFILGRIELRCEYRPGVDGIEVAPRATRQLIVALKDRDHGARVVAAGVCFLDAEGRTYTRREDDRVLSGERISRRMWRRARIGAPLT